MYEFVQYTAADVMTSRPVTVQPEATVGDAQALFEQHGFNGMPVTDGGGALVGFVTKMDVLRAFTLRPDYIVPPYNLIMRDTVDRIMTRDPVSVAPDCPLTRVLQRLVQLGVKSLPVMDADQLVGVVAREDVLGALRKATA
ncbi:CBS domain-containing protein [Aquisalimonas asiatica]|uniref:CBS domain-containing protein n=1 Tax=Aquisalimonas asiatica TaxID=406100 RepID=A0A1H8VBT3_9GAMM|nr:CBS domain-containing protein [Aquisalimonas asiatica]SEP12724.1 CBS domain-containing protein [Aquisalimonas asiatica]